MTLKKLAEVKFNRSGRLVYLGEQKKIKGKYFVRVLCDCGVEKFVNKFSFNEGKVKSCGCLKKEIGNKSRSHGDSRKHSKFHNLYRRWSDIKTRCYNERSRNYTNYGKKGVRMDSKWRDSYEEFKKWALINGYKEELTIDRIDNDGNYEPDNCRWVDMNVQANNKSNNVIIEIDGIRKNITEWANSYGIEPSLPFARYSRGVRGEEIFSDNKRLTKKWSKEETDFILNNWNKLTDEELSMKLSRSIRAITSKAYEYGLSQTTRESKKRKPI